MGNPYHSASRKDAYIILNPLNPTGVYRGIYLFCVIYRGIHEAILKSTKSMF